MGVFESEVEAVICGLDELTAYYVSRIEYGLKSVNRSLMLVGCLSHILPASTTRNMLTGIYGSFPSLVNMVRLKHTWSNGLHTYELQASELVTAGVFADNRVMEKLTQCYELVNLCDHYDAKLSGLPLECKPARQTILLLLKELSA